MSLEDHLLASRLAGTVATSVESCVTNSRRLVAGDPDCTFGLSDWRDATYEEVIAALAACGVRLGDEENPDAPAYVDPSVAAAAVRRQGELLAEIAATKGNVLLATGHAFALLPHYASLARALERLGCTVLEPLGGVRDHFTLPEGESAMVRYYDGVASLVVGGTLRHTHRGDYMEELLAEAGGPGNVQGVIGDHGFAGVAVEAGIPTLSIADVNDPALPLAQARGRTDGVLVIDDGLNPPLYEPLTAAMLEGLRGPNAVAGLRGPNAVAGLPGPNAVAGLRGPNAMDAVSDDADAPDGFPA